MSLQSVERIVRDHVGPQECAAGASPVREGDIWRVEAMPGWETVPRTAVVVRVHSGPVDCAEILLAHTCVEMATTDDAILEPDDTGLARQLVVQPFLRGSVWQMQLTQLLGRVPHRLIKGIGQLYSPERPPEAVRTGAQDPGSADARRHFEDSEREALQALYGDCADAMIDDGPPWQLDPDLASPTIVLRSDNPELVVTDLAHMLRTRRVAATAEYLQLMEESDTPSTSQPGARRPATTTWRQRWCAAWSLSWSRPRTFTVHSTPTAPPKPRRSECRPAFPAPETSRCTPSGGSSPRPSCGPMATNCSSKQTTHKMTIASRHS